MWNQFNKSIISDYWIYISIGFSIDLVVFGLTKQKISIEINKLLSIRKLRQFHRILMLHSNVPNIIRSVHVSNILKENSFSGLAVFRRFIQVQLFFSFISIDVVYIRCCGVVVLSCQCWFWFCVIFFFNQQ